MTDGRHGGWIQVFTGGRVHPLDADPHSIDLRDIAHAHSLTCRFTGHTREFASVAQHAVLVSEAVERATGDRGQALWGLLHDASEAYLCDVARPVKQSGVMFGYRDAEKRLMRVICERFDLDPVEPRSVKEADARMLATEKRDLLTVQRDDWAPLPPAYAETITPWQPWLAEQRFLRRFHDLAPPGLVERSPRPEPRGERASLVAALEQAEKTLAAAQAAVDELRAQLAQADRGPVVGAQP